jgi:hypothetical protein
MIATVVRSRTSPAVGRAAFGCDRAAATRLHYVAFDLLAAGDAGDIQHQPWLRRNPLLAEHLPAYERLRVTSTLPATSDTHGRLVAMGFEGTVLKRQRGSYRPERTRSWRKLKARHQVAVTVAGVHEDRDGRICARCGLQDGRRCTVWADARARLGSGLVEQPRSCTRGSTPVAAFASHGWSSLPRTRRPRRRRSPPSPPPES